MRLLWGFLFIVSGTMIYIFSRENLPYLLSLIDPGYKFYLPDLIKYSFPSFFHCGGMILISSPFIESKKSSVFIISLFWVSIEIIFELGQKFKGTIFSFSPDKGFSPINDYFYNGTFDYNDIMASIAGAVIAIVLIQLSSKNFSFSFVIER